MIVYQRPPRPPPPRPPRPANIFGNYLLSIYDNLFNFSYYLLRNFLYLHHLGVRHRHDDLHVVQRVQTEVIDEVTVQGQLVRGDLRSEG